MALHDVTITSDQWQEVFGNIVAATPTNITSSSGNSKGSSSGAAAGSPSSSNGKRSAAGMNGTSEGTHASSSGSSSSSPPPKGHSSKSKSGSVASASTITNPLPLPLAPVPEPGPYNIHITAVEIAMNYETVLEVVPALHSKPPQLAAVALEGMPEPPEQGYDFIFHVGTAGRGALRMEIIGHKYGYNMKDGSGQYCAVVPPPSATKNTINNNRGPGSGGQPGGMLQPPPYTGGFVHGSGFGSMGMGYNNERLGYNPAVHDPQPGIPGSDPTVRPMRGFGTAYETFPDEMATDIDVTRLVQDLKASGINVSLSLIYSFAQYSQISGFCSIRQTIYTSMDAGHYLCDFLYYCSLAESKRSSKALLPFLTNTSYVAPSPHYGPAYGPHYQMHHFPGPSNTTNAHPDHIEPPNKAHGPPHGPPHGNGNGHNNKPARVLLMHCPPINEPLSSEEVTETIRRIVLWVGREMEIMEMREKAAQEPDEGGAPGFN